MKKTSLPDDRIFTLCDWSVKNDVVENDGAFWDAIGFTRTNIRNVKNGVQGFTREHIRKACVLTGANANWILGLEKNMFRDSVEADPLVMLKKVTAAIESRLQVDKILKNGKKLTRAANTVHKKHK